MTRISDRLSITDLPRMAGVRLVGADGQVVDILRRDIRAAAMVLLEAGPPSFASIQTTVDYPFALVDEKGEIVDHYATAEIAQKFADLKTGWTVERR